MPSLRKRLSRLKLKKIKPGILIKKIVHAGAVLGVPGASSADKVVTRIGKRVDDAKRVYNKAKAEINREAKNRGISPAEAADRLAGRAISGAEAGLGIQANAHELIIGVVAVVVLFLLLKARK